MSLNKFLKPYHYLENSIGEKILILNKIILNDKDLTILKLPKPEFIIGRWYKNLGNNGNIFTLVPTVKFFREGYEHLDVKFDYHVELTVKKEERKNDFQIKIIIELEGKQLMECEVGVNFGRKEMSGNLSARYKFGMKPDFNEIVQTKMKKPNESKED